MNLNLQDLPKCLAKIWPWGLAFVPALVLLLILLPLRGAVPHLDGWSFVQQYQDWVAGGYEWGELFSPHYVHISAVGKVTYFAVLHWFHGDMRLLPLLGWAISVIIGMSVCFLSRPLWTGHRVLGAWLMFCATLVVFSTAQGEAWIWGFLFQNAIPGMCLTVGLVVLSSERGNEWRLAVVALLSVIATFSFGTGFLVALLLTLPVWHGMQGKSAARKWLTIGGWLVFAAALTLVAFRLSVDPDEPGGPSGIPAQVGTHGMRIQFMLILMGQMLAKGTVFEPELLGTVVGGVMMITFVTCVVCVIRQRRDRSFVGLALPWIACGLYGLGSGALICLGRMRSSLGSALVERYVTFSLFFVLGTMLLAVAVARHGNRDWFPVRYLRRLAWPALLLFVTASIINWERGRQAMLLKSVYLEQERAHLAFINVIPLDPQWMRDRSSRKSSVHLAKVLAENGQLGAVKLVSDRRIAVFERGEKISARSARFDEPALLKDGRWNLRGLGGLSQSVAADLILITAQPTGGEEQIVAVTAPLLPQTFFERQEERRSYPGHHFGWSQTLNSTSMPEGTVTLRAYVFEQDARRVRPIEGSHRLDNVRR